MKLLYIIRDNQGGTEESTWPEVAHLMHMGKLVFTGKKLRQSKGDLTTYRYYTRVNREPMTDEVCDKPCCVYLRE